MAAYAQQLKIVIPNHNFTTGIFCQIPENWKFSGLFEIIPNTLKTTAKSLTD
jgi:hypothetical protein